MLVLGDASYALYLVHPFVMRALQIVWLRLDADGPLGLWSYVVAAVAGSVVAALAVRAWIEAPLTHALRRMTSGPV
jgi:peptidoglycan/LPS O-acetylase OafA/YrhL